MRCRRRSRPYGEHKGYLKAASTDADRRAGARLLAAQLVIVSGLSVSVVILIVLGSVATSPTIVPLPSQVIGFILSIVLTMTAMASLGLLIASLATSQRVAGATGGILFFPLMFFVPGCGCRRRRWAQRCARSASTRPLGAAVPSIINSTFGRWPGTTYLLVLAAYTAVMLRIAIRFFRWDR